MTRSTKSRPLPAALSHHIDSDSQRPFAIVIVRGLIGDLLMSIFLLPTLYVGMARAGDKLPEPEAVRGLLEQMENQTFVPEARAKFRGIGGVPRVDAGAGGFLIGLMIVLGGLTLE